MTRKLRTVLIICGFSFLLLGQKLPTRCCGMSTDRPTIEENELNGARTGEAQTTRHGSSAGERR